MTFSKFKFTRKLYVIIISIISSSSSCIIKFIVVLDPNKFFYSLSLFFLNMILVGRFQLYLIAKSRNTVMITIQKTMEI